MNSEEPSSPCLQKGALSSIHGINYLQRFQNVNPADSGACLYYSPIALLFGLKGGKPLPIYFCTRSKTEALLIMGYAVVRTSYFLKFCHLLVCFFTSSCFIYNFNIIFGF